MNLNYTALILISLIPIAFGWLWFSRSNIISKVSGYKDFKPRKLSLLSMIWLFLMSVAFVYGYMNLIIHQMGFYELFFTDIMKGSNEAQIIVDDFLKIYGDKHRHFGHGVFHGVINACMIVLPILTAFVFIENKSKNFFIHHFSYWLITSALIGGLISEFV